MSTFILLQALMGTPALVGVFAVITFLLVYAIRKRWGHAWERVAAYVPALGFDMTPGLTIVSKLFQMLPGALIGAALGAVTSGASLGPTLISALAGPLASVGHELAKAIPVIPYRGETDNPDRLPAPPRLPKGLTLLIVGMVLAIGACLPGMPPTCSPDDAAMAAHAVECRIRVKNECKGVPNDECPVIKECDRWGESRCGNVGEAGSGGDAG